MEREEMLSLWNDMVKEGNWVPSWSDSLAHMSAEDAAWTPDTSCHSVWAEVVHVTYWRQVTLARMHGSAEPPAESRDQDEFAVPEVKSAVAWADAVAAFVQTHLAIAAAIQDPEKDVSRIPYHLIHDAYHLGRITQLRAMRGTAPTF